MNKTDRKKYYNLCNPYKLQDLESGYILDIDNYEIAGEVVNPRGKVWAREIADKISWSDEPQVVYFTGYTGSGKTTELKRVMHILSDEEDANLLPVYINSVDFFDKHSKLGLVDILSIIIYNVSETVAKYIGDESISLNTEDSYYSRLWKWLQDTDVELKSAELEITPTKLIFEMKNRPDFRKRVKNGIETHIERFKREAIAELERLNTKVISYEKDKKRKSGLLVVLDSLEHNRGIGENIDRIAQAAERLFKDRESLLLPFHTIYTIPAYLSTRHIKDIFFLPVVRVYERDSQPFSNALTLMKAFIYERIPKEELESFMNESDLERVILFSGGYPRDLLNMMQKLLISKEDRLQNGLIDTIFLDLENEYKEFVPNEFKEKLLKVNETKELNLNEYEQRDMAYELFSIHAILRYRNGNLWWDLHPALKKVLHIDE